MLRIVKHIKTVVLKCTVAHKNVNLNFFFLNNSVRDRPIFIVTGIRVHP